MKPCSKNRKRIAFLALNALDARETDALRDHLALCEDCRRYSEEISTVTRRLAAAEPDSDLEPSTFFHQRVSEKLKEGQSSFVVEGLATCFRISTLNWHVAITGIAAVVIALLAIVAVRHHPSQPSSGMDQVQFAPAFESDPAPTIANYRIAAHESLEKLDYLLARQGNKPLPPTPAYTASGLMVANASF